MALRGFRFHLSTAVLLMVTAGGLIGLNVLQRFEGLGQIGSGEYRGESCFGFPTVAWIEGGTLIYMNITEAEFRQKEPNLENENQPRGRKVYPR